MADQALGYFIRQFDTTWKLASFHLDGLTTEECLWRPALERSMGRRLAGSRGIRSWSAEHRLADVAHRFLVIDGA
jgi:hypothetical protein